MALTKKMLKGMDIPDDKIELIFEAHAESLAGVTADRDKYKADSEELVKIKKELVKAQAAAEDAEETKEKLNKIRTEFADYKADIENKTTTALKEKAYRQLLKEAGISEKRFDAIVKVTNVSEFELDTDGKIKDSKKVTDNIKSEWADFIVTTKEQGAQTSNPPASTGGNTFEKMSLAEKMDYANENPDSPEVQAWLQ